MAFSPENVPNAFPLKSQKRWPLDGKALGTRWVSVKGVEKTVLSVRNLLTILAAPFGTLRKAVGKMRLRLYILKPLKSEGNKRYFGTQGFVMEKRHTSALVAGW